MALGLAAAALGGCTDFKRAIGLEKVIPDEFAVVSRAPLTVPPDYALRPPRAGAARPQEESTADQARQTVFRAGQQQAALPPPASGRSPGEGALLREAGAASAPTNIRDLVDAEASGSSEPDSSFVDRLEFWRSPDNTDLLNPGKEAARLREASTAGKPVDAGPPNSLDGKVTIERTPRVRTWLGWLF